MLYNLRPYLLSIGGLNIKMEQVSFIPVFFRFSDPRRGKGTLVHSNPKIVNSGLAKKARTPFFRSWCCSRLFEQVEQRHESRRPGDG